MELKDLKFAISEIGNLNIEEKNFIIEAYRNLFAKIYGQDIFDAFLKVADLSSENCENKNDKVMEYASNYKRAKEILKCLDNDANVELLLIYYAGELKGVGRLKRISESVASVPDIAILGVEKIVEREIWKKTISFAETYFIKQGYEKMYIEIPLKEGPLLIRARELGFEENPEDISLEDNNTYLLNKSLERKNNE